MNKVLIFLVGVLNSEVLFFIDFIILKNVNFLEFFFICMV